MKANHFIRQGLILLGAAAAWNAIAPRLEAAVSSRPRGAAVTAVPAGSESVVHLWFQRPEVFVGTVAATGADTITFAGGLGWSPNQWAYAPGRQQESYVAQVRTGVREGYAFPVTGNGPASLIVDLEGASLAGLAAGDIVALVPQWTLGTLFPATDAGRSFVASTNPETPETTVSFGTPRGGGVNQPLTAYFFHAGAWRKTGSDITQNHNDTVLRSDVPLRVRQRTAGISVALAGAVLVGRQAVPLAGGTTAFDTAVSLRWPLPVSLKDSGLAASGAFESSPSVSDRRDLLMVYDGNAATPDALPQAYYFFYNGGWRKLGSPLAQEFGADIVFGPGRIAVIRKGAAVAPGSAIWVHTPP